MNSFHFFLIVIICENRGVEVPISCMAERCNLQIVFSCNSTDGFKHIWNFTPGNGRIFKYGRRSFLSASWQRTTASQPQKVALLIVFSNLYLNGSLFLQNPFH